MSQPDPYQTPAQSGQLLPFPNAEELIQSVQRRFSKVLLVDDSKFLADTLAMFFQLDGFSARAAYGGQDALDAIEDEVPDIAFIDIEMPELNGLDLARRVRTFWRHKTPTLVALSAWEEDSVRQEARDAGFDHFMAKPVDPASLRKFMASLVCDELDQEN